jgi:hypothetical protein
LGVSFKIVTDKDEFLNYKGIKINYSDDFFENAINIKPYGLLSEKDIKKQSLNFFEVNQFKAFFRTSNYEIPFDLFSAAFYLLSFYEEYLPFECDIHGRFKDINSVPFRGGFHEEPIINKWAQFLKSVILNHYPGFIFDEPKFKITITFDIDAAWAFKNKGLLRSINFYLQSAFNRNKEKRNIIKNVLFKNAPDPLFVFDKIITIIKNYNFDLLWFFQVGKYGKYDKNSSTHNKEFRKLIQKLSENYKIGLHTSYISPKSLKITKNEIDKLTNILGKPVKMNRQHFLRFYFPITFENLITCGITDEYSIGYANIVGYRAGIANSFNFFNLYTNEETNLVFHPFIIMDNCLNRKMKLSPDEALNKCKELAIKTKEYNGHFIILFHNYCLSGIEDWKGWENFFEETMNILDKIR